MKDLIKMADDFGKAKKYFIGKKFDTKSYEPYFDKYDGSETIVIDVKLDPKHPDLDDEFLIILSWGDDLKQTFHLTSYDFIESILDGNTTEIE